MPDEDYEPFVAAGPPETEIRVVPESAVAEAVAAERERCAQLADKLAVWVPGKSLGPGRAEPGHWFSEDIRRGDDAT